MSQSHQVNRFDKCWNCGSEAHHRRQCRLPILPGARTTKKNVRKINSPHIEIKHQLRKLNLGKIAPIDLIEKEVERLIDSALEYEQQLTILNELLTSISNIEDCNIMNCDMNKKLPAFFKSVRDVTDHFNENLKLMTNVTLQDDIFEGKVDLLARLRNIIFEKGGKGNGHTKAILRELNSYTNVETDIFEKLKTWRQENITDSSVVEQHAIDLQELMCKLNVCKSNLQIMTNDIALIEERYDKTKASVTKWQKFLYQKNLKTENRLLKSQVAESVRGECRICLENDVQEVVMFCGHTLCSSCVEAIGEFCPFCRAQKEPYIRIYK